MALSQRRETAVGATALTPAARLYLDLLKGCLTRDLFGQAYRSLAPYSRLFAVMVRWGQRLLAKRQLVLMVKTSSEARAEGRDWPADAETMIGRRRLDNLEACIVDAVDRGVPGDLLEAGVWRGGACIFMRAALEACGDTERTVWVADSFQGLPRPDPERFPADHVYQSLDLDIAVPLAAVKANFERYGLLDDRVRFLVGWFSDTLATAPVERLAVLRLDGDMYQSTTEVLEALYPKLSVGGYLIVDDYALPSCKAAVDDYRAKHEIVDPIEPIDWTGVYWRKTAARSRVQINE
jgi:O-methyltransferase